MKTASTSARCCPSCDELRKANLSGRGTMILAAALLGAILLVIGCGGIFLYRVLVEVKKLLEEINAKLPSSPLLTNSY